MKGFGTIYKTELRRYLRMLMGGALALLALFYLLRIKPIFPADWTVNLYFAFGSFGLILFSGISIYQRLANEQKEKTGALTYTLPLAKWKIIQAKLMAVLTYWLGLTLFFFLLLLRLIQTSTRLVLIPQVTNQLGSTIQVTHQPATILGILPELLHIFIITIIPGTLAIVGLVILAYTIYQIIPRFKFPLAILVFLLPLYGLIQGNLLLDQQIVGMLPWPIELPFLKLAGPMQDAVLQTIKITGIPLLGLTIIGVFGIGVSGWLFERYYQN